MYWFKVNGISSKELKIIILKMGPSISAAKKIESIEVPGRNGNLHIDDNCYKSKEITIECDLLDIKKIDTVKSLLDGIISVELSTEPGRIYKAVVTNQIDFDVFAKNERVFPLQLELEPFSRGSKNNVVIDTSTYTLNVGGNAPTYPIINVEGSGKISINNVVIETLSNNITLDCEMQECTISKIGANDKVIIDKFPHLINGVNNIAFYQGVSKLTIFWEERWK